MIKFLFGNFKNYIKEVENILKEKDFDEQTKGIILSLTYKLVEAYPDYRKVKINVLDEYKFFNIYSLAIKNNIKRIELIRPEKINLEEARKSFEEGKQNTHFQKTNNNYEDEIMLKPEGRRYIVDKEKKTIKVYASELDMYSAILEFIPKYFTVNDEYIFKETLERILREGSFLNYLELFTDFKGYSWYQNYTDKFPYIKNLIFQSLIILLGPNFMFSWEQRKYNISDYIKEMEISLIKQYGKDNSSKILFCLYSVIYNYATQSERVNIKSLVNKSKNRLEKMDNHRNFLEDIQISKTNAIERIENIDLVLNNDEFLIKAFEKNQANIANEHLTINQYIRKVKEEREKLLKKIDFLNILQKPTSYIEYKEELKRQIESFEGNLKINEAVFEFEIAVLRALEYKIIKCGDNSQNLKYLKLLRYFKFQNLDKDLKIKDIKQIYTKIQSLEKMLITNACKTGNIKMISYNIELNYNIISKVLNTRILDIDDIQIELDYKDNKLGLRLYYKENIEAEEVILIDQDPMLAIRLRKKIKLFN